MHRIAMLTLLLGACGADGPTYVVTATVPITQMFGNGSSYLQKYIGMDLGFEVSFPSAAFETYDTTGCNNTRLVLDDAPRRATGALATNAQRELLDPLDQAWEVVFEVCAEPTQTTITLDSVIDPYNLSFGCGVVPASAQRLGEDGYPVLSSFTATRCNATILDVINAYTIGNADFAMTISER
jgi:hypothetical protein